MPVFEVDVSQTSATTILVQAATAGEAETIAMNEFNHADPDVINSQVDNVRELAVDEALTRSDEIWTEVSA